MSGYIKLHRKLLDHPRYQDPEYMHVWVHMLMKACFADHEVLWQGKIVRLKPGQFTAGRKQIANETGVNESKVKRS